MEERARNVQHGNDKAWKEGAEESQRRSLGTYRAVWCGLTAVEAIGSGSNVFNIFL